MQLTLRKSVSKRDCRKRSLRKSLVSASRRLRSGNVTTAARSEHGLLTWQKRWDVELMIC